MARATKEPPPITASSKTYEFRDWEGGIGVYAMSGTYGVKIIAVPRLGVSTTLTGTHDYGALCSMLDGNKTMYRNVEERNEFAQMILRDFAR